MPPSNSIPDRYDAIVIGTGAGGGMAGYKLASMGKRILFVERGRLFDDTRAFQDEQAMQIEKRASDDRQFDFGGLRERPFIGGIAGGSTSLYGACLMRPGPSDFTPGRYYGRYLDRSLWDWPISPGEMAPFYTEAENIFRVAGESGQVTPHLMQRTTDYPAEPLPLHPTNIALKETFEKAGLRPFTLPLGIDPSICDRCPTCPGYICPTGARASSLNRCIVPAVDKHNAVLLTETEITAVKSRRRRIVGLELKNPAGNYRVAADLFILSGGAIGSPAFLMQHGMTGGNDIIGRNYMFHLGVIFTALCAHRTGAGREFIKQLGITDMYLSDGAAPHKLGYIQQLPIPGVLTMQEQLPIPLPGRFLDLALTRNITFAGAIEDLPQPSNRVALRSGGITITHRYHPYDVHRAQLMKKGFLPAMRRIPSSLAFAMIAKNEKLHVAHQVGTCRFGNDPATSALDKNCRLHHLDNFFVLDGSFMPTSLGVAPALTIMANALRVVGNII
ncbi:GMC family oxidoreductase [uncultured Desulfosarcina sp.]|uniref:GMC family oxidoreductase n=1 Tax=uncultured Desulfosarcina sp. TaxID=218289 RepID=UPI0029C80F5B|nr:GMC family oxidoreductase [uncultured Desulfosarcina sp.]